MEESAKNCVVCFQVMLHNIYICSSGHSLCGNCQKKISTCPQCRESLHPVNRFGSNSGITIRNYQLENLIKEITSKQSCRNKHFGCTHSGPSSDIHFHETNCRYRDINCRFSIEGCKVLSKSDTIIIHEAVCKFRKVNCIFAVEGCPEKLTIVELAEHEQHCKFRVVLTTSGLFDAKKIIRCCKCKEMLLGQIYLTKSPLNQFFCGSCVQRNIGTNASSNASTNASTNSSINTSINTSTNTSTNTISNTSTNTISNTSTNTISNTIPNIINAITIGITNTDTIPDSSKRMVELELMMGEIGEMLTPCSFQSDGCIHLMKLSEKKKHEKECEHRTVSCEFKDSCNFKGKFGEIKQHYLDNHSQYVKNLEQSKSKAASYTTTVSSSGKNLKDLKDFFILILEDMVFYLKGTRDETHLYLIVFSPGLSAKALNYEYKIKIRNDGASIAGKQRCLGMGQLKDNLEEDSNSVSFYIDAIKKFEVDENIIIKIVVTKSE